MTETFHKVIIGDARNMKEVPDESVHLVVTSPPYPMIQMWDAFFASKGKKKYDLMHDYLKPVWDEIGRVLIPGGIACVNIGDATRTVNGRFQLYPNHARITEYFHRELKFVVLTPILWKKPTNRPNAFLGSGFLPPNAYVTLDCEYILIFRKAEPRKFKPKDPARLKSKYTKRERDIWFSQIWDIKGCKQNLAGVSRRVASFPREIPRRLIKMFSVEGETVLDPFLGTGTTMKIAYELKRNSIGYEIDRQLISAIRAPDFWEPEIIERRRR